MRLAAFACTLLLIALTAAPGHAEKRVALVVGNDAYPNLPADQQLRKAVNDARAVGDALGAIGFQVIRGENLGRQALVDKLDELAQRLEPGDTAFFFFAGHGVAIAGGNYILPVDVPNVAPGQDVRLARGALLENDIVADLQGHGVRIAVVVLDACRNNPFKKPGVRGVGSERGLGRFDPVRGVFTIYSAGVGQTALDRLGDADVNPNSVFTRVLVPTLTRPGLDLGELAVGVREEVARLAATVRHEQRPAYYDETIGGRVYLAGQPTEAKPAEPSGPSVAGPGEAERVWFGGVKDTTSTAVLEDFVRHYPDTIFATMARARLEALKKQQVAVAPPAIKPATPQPAQPAPPAPASPPPAANPPPARPALALGNVPRIETPSWTAGAADVAAWRLRTTTRLGGALSRTAVSLDRTTVAVTADREGSLHVVDAMTLKPSAKITLTAYEKYSLGGIAILSSAGTRRVAVVRAGALEVYDIASKARVQSVPAHRGYTGGHLRLARDGQRLYFIQSSVSPQASIIAVYATAPQGLVLDTEYAFDVRIDSFDVTADGGKFLLGTYPANQLVLYDARARQIVWAQTCQCSGAFGAGDRLIAFAGRPGASAGDFGKTSSIGVLDAADPARRAVFDTRAKEELNVDDVSPDGLLAAIGSTNNGQVAIVPISLDAPVLRPLIILKDNSGQSIAGATFVGRDALVTMSGDNNARLWKR